ncbi:MAG TPA: DNA primase [Bryobacteraceae bacterium]|nr:DNA primase [Bryobacteraceae bacterium]
MDFVDQLKSSVDIVSVVGEYVRLRKSGSNRYMGLCPFHNEKKPSFTVHVVHQFYKCFSCGVSGDVVKFVQEKEGISFFEALRLLSERYGIPMPRRSEYSDPDTRLRAAIYQMHELAQENFQANLNGPAGEGARAYLARRGVTPEVAAQFGLGYSERGGRALVRLFEQNRFPAEQMEASGLAGRRQDGSLYDRFRNRLMFPIHNESGKIIAFGGRALASDDEPKYLNSPETPIYKKGHVLYNLHRAKEAIRKEDRAILVEGYMDAIGVSAAGFRCVVAVCGTALKTAQVQSLKRHSQRIMVNFDPDGPGASAAERHIDLLLEESMQVHIMELDGGLDPDEYCKERGAAAYGTQLDSAKGYFHWLADRARKKYDVHTSEGVVAVLQFLLPAVQRVSDRIERMAIANELAGYIGVERGLVLDRFRKIVEERQERTFTRPQIVMRADERLLLQALLVEPAMREEVLHELKTMEAISRLSSRRIFQAIFALADAGGRLDFDNVHARLDEADQNLLAEAVLAVETSTTREEVLAAVESMRRSEQQQRRSELKGRIREAERAGNLEQALRLTEELQGIERDARARR